ncbi:MAG: hypothetical protein Q4B45_00580 [Coriobacteriia bacterium]|nr:hypothetical protein [Coriobacteriia bacterium]
MFYDYCELADGTQVGYSERLHDGSVEVVAELPIYEGFKTARFTLPAMLCTFNDGFSDNELNDLSTFVRNNSQLIFRFSDEVSKDYA